MAIRNSSRISEARVRRPTSCSAQLLGPADGASTVHLPEPRDGGDAVAQALDDARGDLDQDLGEVGGSR